MYSPILSVIIQKAILMDGIVPNNVRAKRSKMLRGFICKEKKSFYESQLGTIRTVLFEGKTKKVTSMDSLKTTSKLKLHGTLL